MTFSVAATAEAPVSVLAATSVASATAATPAAEKSRCAACSARTKGLCAALPAEQLPDLTTSSRTINLLSASPVVHEGEEAEAVFTVV